MNIGSYTFAEFKQKAAEFHGYPAPGLLIGAYMVEKARAPLPEGTLFEAAVETKKCLPDAVQLLTLCSVGNQWMKIVDLGRYALSLYDKFTGEGFRVHLDLERMRDYPEILGWYLKLKPKKEQDSERLFQEIERAGDGICGIAPIRVRPRLLGHGHMDRIAPCPLCGEAYPINDGPVCRGCQGEAPYTVIRAGSPAAAPLPGTPATENGPPLPGGRIVPVAEAVGKAALHDMTRIIPGESKEVAFTAGRIITVGDVCRLQQMGRFNVAVAEGGGDNDYVHENAGVEAFARRMAGANIVYDLPPKEGKINFRAAVRGLLSLDRARLLAFNMAPDVMCATRQDATVVEAGTGVAASRVIPLYIHKDAFAAALSVLEAPLFRVDPLRKAKVGVLVTGTEVFQGLIEDRFIPTIAAKVAQYDCDVAETVIAPDDPAAIRAGIDRIRAAGADLLITTAGLSVDPDDVTRQALMEAGLTDMLYGAPVLPGGMSLVGLLPSPEHAPEKAAHGPAEDAPVPLPPGAMQVLGVPACALYSKTTLFDGLLPRLLAGRRISRQELALMAEGGFCMNCKRCTWPKCFFMK